MSSNQGRKQDLILSGKSCHVTILNNISAMFMVLTMCNFMTNFM